VSGESVTGTGVLGHTIEAGSVAVSGVSTQGVGVQGGSHSGAGVQGNSQYGTALQGGNVSETKPAVQGWAQNGQTGVMGVSTSLENIEEIQSPRGVGVFGVSDRAGGRGVLARSRDGIGLEVKGRVRLSTSGRVVVPAASSEVLVTPRCEVSPSAIVLATAQSDPGDTAVRWVEVDAGRNRFVIHMRRAVASDAVVAWVLLG
jgi:hypothetical protein